MRKKRSYKNRVELLQGTLDMLILQTVQWGEHHGHSIAKAIQARSGELLKVETGSLYPALHRLEGKGWLKATWKRSDSNHRAKFYRLTAQGMEQLLEEKSRWAQMVEAIGKVLEPVPPGEEV